MPIDYKATDVHAALVQAVGFDGERTHWRCKHQHRTPQAAALCGQQEIRRRLPNTRDKADQVRYLAVRALVLVKCIEDGQVRWYDWAADNNIETF